MKAKILVIDDSVISLANVEQNLKDKYEVITVNSGSRALRFLRREKPDLILLDIRMAEMDGIETLKEIKKIKDCADIPVIMLTSRNDMSSIVECQRQGISDYVLKPFNPEELQGRIERAMAGRG